MTTGLLLLITIPAGVFGLLLVLSGILAWSPDTQRENILYGIGFLASALSMVYLREVLAR